MKNKFIVLGMALVSVCSLASCKKTKSDDYNSQRYVDLTTIEDSVESDLKLFYTDTVSLQDGGQLLGESSVKTTRFDIYVSKDANNSLFVYNYDLTEYFSGSNGKNNKTVTVSSLAMSMVSDAEVYSSEKSSIVSQAFDSKIGVSTLFADAAFKVNSLSSWTTSLSSSLAYKAFKKDSKTISLSVVYMPLYVEHYVKTQAVLKEYVFLPVHVSFTTSDGKELVENEWVDSTIKSLTTVNLENYLNSNSTVKTTTQTEE